MNLRLAQIRTCTEAEGPGKRYALWVQGCSIRCPGCCNPEMFEPAGDPHDIGALLADIALQPVEGVTVLGGEPFEQARPLVGLARGVHAQGRTVMVFTGYRLEALRARHDPDIDALLAATDLLVDGPYLRDQPDTERRWIGSRNQRLFFLTDRYRPTDPRFWSHNTVEIRFDGTEILVNGWPVEGLEGATAAVNRPSSSSRTRSWGRPSSWWTRS